MKTLTLSIEQLQAIINKAKKEQKSNVHLSSIIEISQYEGATTAKICAHDSVKHDDLIINEFYDRF